MTTTQTQPIVRPATSGECGIVGCTSAADVEVERRISSVTFTVALYCVHHAPAEALR